LDTPRPSSLQKPGPDVALVSTGVIALIGWWNAYVLPVGPWWALIWLGPVLYAALRSWRSGRRLGRSLAMLPVAGFLLLGQFECAVAYTDAWPWWLSHVGMGLLLTAVAGWLLVGSETKRFGPRLVLFTLAVMTLPWLWLDPLNGFWSRCVRLRLGMSVDEVVAVFGDCYLQNPGTQDGCDRSPVAGIRLEDWRDERYLTFYPFPADDEGWCTADGCWATFEDGSLVGFRVSPD
jgi:hypothetical protein